MTPPTVPMPDDAEGEQVETPPTSASTEAGNVDVVDDKGPKACAADTPAPGGEGGQAEAD